MAPRIATAAQVHFYLGKEEQHTIDLHHRSGTDYDVVELVAGTDSSTSLSLFFHRTLLDLSDDLSDTGLVMFANQLETIADSLRRAAQERIDAKAVPA